MARILIDFVESDKKMIKTLQYFANPLISGLKSFKTHLYGLVEKKIFALEFIIFEIPLIQV